MHFGSQMIAHFHLSWISPALGRNVGREDPLTPGALCPNSSRSGRMLKPDDAD
jgi:hypothetical protein